MELSILILFFGSFLLVAAVIPLACKLALRVGFVDAPGGRKQHDGAVPPVGGLVIFSVYLGALFFADVPMDVYWPLFVGVLALLGVGAMDDRVQVGAWVKFAVQIVIAFMVVLFGVCKITNLGDMFGFGDLELGFMAVPFSVAAVALLINAINLMDGVDGLSGGVSFVVLGLLTFVAFVSGSPSVFVVVPLMGAVAGFLIYNMRHPWRQRASVFMGDAGTLSMGLVLAWFSIGFAGDPAIDLEAINVAWFLAIPIMDECAQFYRRVREGRHPFSPDRGHFHHHFLDSGFAPGRATLFIVVLSFGLGGGAYGLLQLGVPQLFLTAGWIVTLLAHMHVSQTGAFYKRVLSTLA